MSVEFVNGGGGDLYDAGGAPLTDRHAEELLLGYLLATPQAMHDIADILRPSDFCDPFHRRIFECIEKSQSTGQAVTELIASLGGDSAAKIVGDLTAGQYCLGLIARVDDEIAPAEVADHIQQCAERRAIGDADDIDFGHGRPFVSRFGGLRWEEIGADQTTSGGYTWAVEDILPMGEISLIFGDSGTGKSFNAFDMSMSIARGIKFNGMNVEPGLVVYIAAEAGKGFAKRKAAYLIQNNLQADAPFPFYLLTKRPDFFHDDADVHAVIDEIKIIAATYRQPLVCIVLDTLSALAPGMNENASADVSMVRKRLVMMQDAFECSIVLVHHKPKNGTTPRGHGSLTADFETTIEFETLNDKKAPDGRTIHRATVRKQREGKPGIKWEFTLPVIKVGKNKWGNDETSCAVAPFAVLRTETIAGGFHANRTELLFMHALFEALNDHAEPPPPGLPPSITKAVDARYVREKMRERSIDRDVDPKVADNRFRNAYHRAASALRDGGVIGVHNKGNNAGLFWSTGKPVVGLSIELRGTNGS